MTDDPVDDRHAWERRGAFEIVPGVHRIPLPLPGDGLKAVNVYAIDLPDGVALVDSGWALGEARQQLEDGLALVGHDLGSVRRVLVTHVHRDHYELGAQLQKLFGAHLALGIGEQPSLTSLIAQDDGYHGPMHLRLLSAGAAPLVDLLEKLRARRAERGEIHPMEWRLPDEWLQDSQVVDLGGRSLEVVATPGHTRGHVVFVDRAAGVLFSGDHVLPHITPSIGFEHVPVATSLADYMGSLAIVRGLPDLRLLPAHGPVRPTTHDRVDELLAFHEHRLRQCVDAVRGGASTTWDVAHVLTWTRRETAFVDLDPFNQMLAVNETAAHLDVLVDRGACTVTEEQGGAVAVRHYQLA